VAALGTPKSMSVSVSNTLPIVEGTRGSAVVALREFCRDIGFVTVLSLIHLVLDLTLPRSAFLLTGVASSGLYLGGLWTQRTSVAAFLNMSKGSQVVLDLTYIFGTPVHTVRGGGLTCQCVKVALCRVWQPLSYTQGVPVDFLTSPVHAYSTTYSCGLPSHTLNSTKDHPLIYQCISVVVVAANCAVND
jgi:hypothetical protein